jgi:hypothetical protein
MSIENQIAAHADEPEQLSANEILVLLLDDRPVLINGEHYELNCVTCELEDEAARELCESILLGDDAKVRELYIKTIQEMME